MDGLAGSGELLCVNSFRRLDQQGERSEGLF
jgi:hypothetical protein